MSITALTYFDESYEYMGYVLVNEIYPDDEGFNKNQWFWGKLEGSGVTGLTEVIGLPSRSYSSQPEAYKAFVILVNETVLCQK